MLLGQNNFLKKIQKILDKWKNMYIMKIQQNDYKRIKGAEQWNLVNLTKDFRTILKS
jgi:hypothetical protein